MHGQYRKAKRYYKNKKILKSKYITLALIIMMIAMSIGYSYWHSSLEIKGRVIAKGNNKSPDVEAGSDIIITNYSEYSHPKIDENNPVDIKYIDKVGLTIKNGTETPITSLEIDLYYEKYTDSDEEISIEIYNGNDKLIHTWTGAIRYSGKSFLWIDVTFLSTSGQLSLLQGETLTVKFLKTDDNQDGTLVTGIKVTPFNF